MKPIGLLESEMLTQEKLHRGIGKTELKGVFMCMKERKKRTLEEMHSTNEVSCY